MQTLKYRILNEVAAHYGLSFEHINHLFQTHIPVHPAVAKTLKQMCSTYEHINDMFAQDFVEQDKLLELIKHCFKNNLATHYLLAMDGLNGPKLNNGPCLDPKFYLDNMRFGTDATPNQYEKATFRGSHTWAVRKVYQEIGKTDYAKPVEGVYLVMCQVLKDVGGVEIPVVEDLVPLDPLLMDLCVNVYREEMPMEHFTEWVNSLTFKIIQLGEEEGTSGERVEEVIEGRD